MPGPKTIRPALANSNRITSYQASSPGNTLVYQLRVRASTNMSETASTHVA